MTLVPALVVGGLGPPDHAAAEGQITVDWPDQWRLNPDLSDYVIEANYDGPGTLFVTTTLSAVPQEIAAGAPVVVDFSRSGVQNVLVWECEDPAYDTTCVQAARSGQVAAFREFVITDVNSVKKLGPATSTPLTAAPREGTVDLAWEVVPVDAPNADPLVSGSATDQAPGAKFPSIGAAEALEQGHRYLYRVTVSGDTSNYGSLSGSYERPFTWDAQVEASIEIRNQRGDFIAKLRAAGGGTLRANWNGREGPQGVQSRGDYLLTATVTDDVGNRAVVTASITISLLERMAVIWRRTFRAAPTVIRKSVGSCARLRRPARSGWPGSLGYRSQSRCSRLAQTAVATSNGAYVKRSPFNIYRATRITVNGGKAKGERSSYLVMHYLNQSNDWVEREVLPGAMGRHRGPWLTRGKGVFDGESRPYVVWSVGLGSGAKYDVKSFTVEMTYVDLR